MASSADWRAALTASERYENIQKIRKAAYSATLKASAFTLENDAYTSASSRDDYDAACALLSKPPVDATGAVGHGAIAEPEPEPEPEGTPPSSTGDDEDDLQQIGSYTHCRYIARGVTAEVYRSGARALKVIVEAHDMQPHDHLREAQILRRLRGAPNIVTLLETFRDADQRFVLVFPYMPSSLEGVLRETRYKPHRTQLLAWFADVFAALAHLHAQGILHRDIKLSAVLLGGGGGGPAYLSDFGTAWHPQLSPPVEPADAKVLDVGTGPYRAPEVLFGDQAYGASVDMWAAGAMLAEAAATAPFRDAASAASQDDGGNPRTLFASRAAHEDGSQLGLILSIFKTIGTPTRETWPEAAGFRTPPFEMYREFPARPWEDVLPGVDGDVRQLVARLIRYGSTRATASEALAAIKEMQEGGDSNEI